MNDEHRHPNCKMKKIEVNGNPHLCLFALNDVKEGEEITYDYGGDDCPWRTQVCWTVHSVWNSSYCSRMQGCTFTFLVVAHGAIVVVGLLALNKNL